MCFHFKKILDLWLVCRSFYPLSSGASERFRRYALGLMERGVLMSVATVGRPGLSSFEETDGISVLRFFSDGNRYLEDFRFFKWVYGFFKHRGFPDVIQFFEPSLVLFPFIRLFRRRASCLYVHTILLEGKLFRVYLRYLLGSMDAVVSSSGVMTRELCGLGIPEGFIHTIVNGVDTERFRPPRSYGERLFLRQRLGFGEDDEIVLFVGMLIPRKGVHLLLEAWREIGLRRPRAKLVIVGSLLENQPKHESYRERIRELVVSSSAPERVVFTGEVGCVEDYMRVADLFVFPSEREGFGNVVAEAMASGLPVILTPFIGRPFELGFPGKHYLLVERSSRELAESVCWLLEDPLKREVLGGEARLWAEEHLKLERTLDRFAELYWKLKR